MPSPVRARPVAPSASASPVHPSAESASASSAEPAPAAGRGRAGLRVGVVVKDFHNPYYAGVIAGVREQVAAEGGTVLAASSDRVPEAEQRAVMCLAHGGTSQGVAGLVIAPALDEGADLSYLFELRRRQVPFVLLGDVRGVPASAVGVDNAGASQAVGEHLLALGHTRIVHLAGPRGSLQVDDRVVGLRRACAAARIPFSDADLLDAGARLEDGYRAARAYLAATPPERRATAVTCFNDLVAIGACRALAEAGLRVPDDVAVVGFDDLPLLEYLPVPITSVRVPTRELGRQAALLLAERIVRGPAAPTRKVYLEAALVVRRSTAGEGR